MSKMVKQVILTIIGNFLGILIASLVLHNFKITPFGIFTSVLIFTVAQIAIAPIVSRLASKYAPSLASMVALITTFLSLLLTSIFTSGLRIEGFVTWISASVLVWLLTILMGIVLPKVLFTAKKKDKQDSKNI